MSHENGSPVDPPAFSNGTSFFEWQSVYCDRCWNDRGYPDDESKFCGLITLGMAHEVVPQWVYAESSPYGVHCTAFRPDDGGPDETIPQPEPPPEGQELLFDASAFDSFPAVVVEPRAKDTADA